VEVGENFGQLLYHNIVIGCVVACDSQHLKDVRYNFVL
jgi:hypothetical protein